MDFKTWKPGEADAPWKLLVCARDFSRAEDHIQGVANIVVGPGNRTVAEAAEVLKKLTSEQIVDGLVKYAQSAYQSVVNGIKKNNREETQLSENN